MVTVRNCRHNNQVNAQAATNASFFSGKNFLTTIGAKTAVYFTLMDLKQMDKKTL